MLENLIKEQNEYLARTGGPLALREADDFYNNLNRKQICAFREERGTTFLGSVNFYDDERIAVIAGEKSVYEEYTGQRVYNFGCSFCVPCADEEMAEMIRKWNCDGLPKNIDDVDAIVNRVAKLGGINFIWY